MVLVLKVVKQRTQLAPSSLSILPLIREPTANDANGQNASPEITEKNALRRLAEDSSLLFNKNDFIEMLKVRGFFEV